MALITFESAVRDNVIEIPEEYRGQLPASVTVTISDSKVFRRSTPPIIIPPRKCGPFTKADFNPPHIDTSGWEFDREEANER
jgi:hypothetical protein